MPAFLGAQSFIMMYQAGEGWQYGKRRISALSNEEFNKITPASLMERQAMELKGAIPIMERSMNNMTRMVPMIIEQYGDFIREAIKAMPQAIANITGGTEFTNIPTSDSIQGGSTGSTFSALQYAKILLSMGVDLQKIKDATSLSQSQINNLKLDVSENTFEKRLAIQKAEDARVARLQAMLKVKAQASIRLETRQQATPIFTKRGGSIIQQRKPTRSAIKEKARITKMILLFTRIYLDQKRKAPSGSLWESSFQRLKLEQRKLKQINLMWRF